jgi:hypothetical protein
MVAQILLNLFPLNLKEITRIGNLPTDIDNCICITETGGSHGTYFAKDQLNKPFIKISIRNQDYEEGYRLAEQLKECLTSYADASTSIILYGTIQYFGQDDSRRNIFQLTYKVLFK